MNELALFAGAGGGLLASQWLKRWKTVCYVEWAEYPSRIIEARIRDGILDDAPIWDNVGTFDGIPWRGYVDVITAGFPCQPFSHAGKQESNNDMRNGWPDTIRIINEVKPKFALLENVTGLLSAMDKSANESNKYFGTILRDLAESGYDAEWDVLSARKLGFPIERERIFIACTHKEYGKKRVGDFSNRKKKILRGSANQRDEIRLQAPPRNPGMGNGVAYYMDRVGAIGNGQVPLVASTAWDMLRID